MKANVAYTSQRFTTDLGSEMHEKSNREGEKKRNCVVIVVDSQGENIFVSKVTYFSTGGANAEYWRRALHWWRHTSAIAIYRSVFFFLLP